MRALTRSTMVKLGQHFGDTHDGETPSFLGFDIVEFMPERGPQRLAALTAARLVYNAVGLIARQR